MQLLFMALFAAGIVAADQFTKFLTVANIPLYQDVEFIPGFLGFTYIQNTGAAFSSFEGQQWLFALIFLIFTAAIIWEYKRKSMDFSTFERWCIAATFVLTSFSDFIMTQYNFEVRGDMNGDGVVNDTDVAYLLWHTLFPDLYEISGNADFNQDGNVDDADVAYLLWHTLFPESYPIF